MRDDQQSVIDFLAGPAAHDGAAVERIDTHSAVVFLSRTRALKLKRAVKFDYLDFSTPALRKAASEAEVRINARSAPSLYRGVIAVTREADGSLALDGAGTPIDWLVHMARFDQSGLFDRLAARDALDLSLMRPLADAIAEFHQHAPTRADHGGRAGMAWVVEGNAEGFAEQGKDVLDPGICDRLTAAARAAVEHHAALLDSRRDDGRVRECHGDLHLRNIVLLDGVPTLFDAVEFNDDISCIDVLYDLAFVLMDLWRRTLHQHANVLFNAYLAHTADAAPGSPSTAAELSGLALMPLFLSCRAAVRAKTSATAARMQPDDGRKQELEVQAREYLEMALRLITPEPPALIAVGGLSGSGKSTLAMGLAPSVGAAPGALVLRSDEIRKSLAGVSPLERLGPGGYTPDMSARVYDTLAERATAALRAGHPVIADAVLARPGDRAPIERVAASAGVPFIGIWLDASPDVLLTRVGARGADVSDADAAVVRAQLAQDVGAITWHRIDASAGPGPVLERARTVLPFRAVGPAPNRGT